MPTPPLWGHENPHLPCAQSECRPQRRALLSSRVRTDKGRCAAFMQPRFRSQLTHRSPRRRRLPRGESRMGPEPPLPESQEAWAPSRPWHCRAAAASSVHTSCNSVTPGVPARDVVSTGSGPHLGRQEQVAGPLELGFSSNCPGKGGLHSGLGSRKGIDTPNTMTGGCVHMPIFLLKGLDHFSEIPRVDQSSGWLCLHLHGQLPPFPSTRTTTPLGPEGPDRAHRCGRQERRDTGLWCPWTPRK